MEYRYRVYSSSVELNKASYSPNPLYIEEIVCIIVSNARWHSSSESDDVLKGCNLGFPILNCSCS